jgi:putative ABC transport system permease protein
VSLVDLVRFSASALRGHRLRSGLSLLGVAIGVASVIVLTSLGEGARLYVTREFSALGTNLLIVIPGKTETTGAMPIFGGVPNDLTLEDAEALARHVRQVRATAPLTFGQASARVGAIARDVTVTGTTAEFRRIRKIDMRLGRYLPAGASRQAQRVCVIGPKIQRELFRDANPLGEILRLGDERFRVIGVLEPRGTSLGINLDEVVHVPVRSGLRMFNQSGLFRVFVEVRSHEEIEAAKRAVIELIRERHNDVEDITVQTQDAVLTTFGGILIGLTAALAGIAAVSLSVAGVGIMNVMLVSVSERTSEIGLLKALGASRWQIVWCFLFESAILSGLGGMLGLASGFSLNRVVTTLYPAFPVQPPPGAVTAALALSVLVGLVFGSLPARRAARLDPVAALARR